MGRARRRNAERGGETITNEEMRALLAAPSPLASWRDKGDLTAVELAWAAARSRSYAAGLESGARKGDPVLFTPLAAALRVPMKDIVAD